MFTNSIAYEFTDYEYLSSRHKESEEFPKLYTLTIILATAKLKEHISKTCKKKKEKKRGEKSKQDSCTINELKKMEKLSRRDKCNRGAVATTCTGK